MLLANRSLRFLLLLCSVFACVSHAAAFSVERTSGGPAVVISDLALYDPWEIYNRRNYLASARMDDALLKPIAVSYSKKVPSPFKTIVDNFFDNISDLRTAVNELLQGKMEPFLSDFARVILNTVFGVLGTGNVAGVLGWSRNYEDFGLTLAHWNIKPGPYLFLPVIGPTTVRAGLGILVDQIWNPALYLPGRVVLFLLWGLNSLSELLDLGPVVMSPTVDQYVFIRSSYWQHRVYLINDDDYLNNPFSQQDLNEIMKDPLEL